MSSDETESIAIDEKLCIPTVEKICDLFHKEKTPELIAYVSLRILMQEMEKRLDIRSCVTVPDADPNGEIN